MQRLNVGQARYAIIGPAVAMVAALGSTAAFGQAQIAQPGVRDTRPLVLPKPLIVAPSERLGLALVGVPTVHLRPVDVDALLAEDAAEAQFGSKALRVSIARDVLLLLRDGQWHDVDGGSLWVADILAEGAIGLRLHFTGMDLPQGAEVVVTGSDKDLPMQGPFTKQGLLGDGAFWSGSTLGERARIEYFVPDGAAGGNPDVPFAVDSLQHVYVDIYRGANGGGEGAVGPCHNEPACFAAWDDVEDSVGRIFIAQTGFLCCGQLVNAVNSDLTPYYLTARHCISTASQAASAEVLWQFEARTCGGGISGGALSDVCSLVSTYFSADETLLMVEGTLPTGLFWSGWQTSATLNNTPSTCIHHPSGDYKRISFGTKFNTPNCGGSSTNFLLMSWSSGVTEGGSSGAGIWRNSDQLLFGTLTCGVSSCVNPNGNDSYGRFDRAYNAGGFSVPLAAGSDDAFENNDSCATAAALPTGTFGGQVVKSIDEDWYVVTLATLGNISVDLTFTHSFGDIDMELFDGCGGALIASALSNTNDETLSYTNFGTTSTLFLRIFLDNDTRNGYTMAVSFGPLHDECANAPFFFAGTNTFGNIGASTDGPSEAACNFNGDSQIQSDVWYRYPALCDGIATVSLCGSTYDTKLAVYGPDCPAGPGTVIACNNDFCGQQSEVSFPVTLGSQYRIRIGGHLGAQGTGTLTITCVPDALPCPEDVNGDGDINVLDLIDLLLCFGQPAVPGCEAEDVSGDGTVNVLDLIDLLLLFGQPCP